MHNGSILYNNVRAGLTTVKSVSKIKNGKFDKYACFLLESVIGTYYIVDRKSYVRHRLL